MVEISPPSLRNLPSAKFALHRVDPRVRIVAILAFAITVTALSGLVALVMALGVSAVFLALSDLPRGQTLRRMAGMDGFIIFMLLMLPFTMPGTPLFTLPGGFTASREGLLRAVDIGLTANAVVLMVLVQIGTMDAVTLGHALSRLKVPPTLVHLMLFTVRYIDVLRNEYARSRQAMKARAFRPRNNLHTLTSFGNLVGMMLVRAFERSERILKAMQCRGFHGQFPLLEDLRMTQRDGIFAALFALILVVLVGVDLS